MFACVVCCIYKGLERVHETGDKRAALLAPISETLKENDACVFVCVACCIHTGLERVHETGDKRAALLAPIAETLIGDATYMACTSATTPSPAEVIRRTLFFCLTAAELP